VQVALLSDIHGNLAALEAVLDDIARHGAAEVIVCLGDVAMLDQKKELPRTHNLVELARDLGASEEISEAARELTPDYLTTRYPNAANGVPAEMYSHQSAQVHLDYARRIMEWTQKLLPQ